MLGAELVPALGAELAAAESVAEAVPASGAELVAVESAEYYAVAEVAAAAFCPALLIRRRTPPPYSRGSLRRKLALRVSRRIRRTHYNSEPVQVFPKSPATEMIAA